MSAAGREAPDYPVKVGPLIAALAARQHGLVSASQPAAHGVAQQTISDRVADGAFIECTAASTPSGIVG